MVFMWRENFSAVFVIINANRGIGFAVAKGLLQKGIQVVVTSRSEESGIEAVEKLSEFGQAFFYRLNVREPETIAAAYAFVEKEFGKLNILINNAGINYDTWQQVENADLEEVRSTFETNTFAPWKMIQFFLPLLRQSASPRIVNVSSGGGTNRGPAWLQLV